MPENKNDKVVASTNNVSAWSKPEVAEHKETLPKKETTVVVEPVKKVEPITVPVENMFVVENTTVTTASSVEVKSGKAVDLGFDWSGMFGAVKSSVWEVPTSLNGTRDTFEGSQTMFHANGGAAGYYLLTNTVVGSNDLSVKRSVSVHIS